MLPLSATQDSGHSIDHDEIFENKTTPPWLPSKQKIPKKERESRVTERRVRGERPRPPPSFVVYLLNAMVV